MVSSCFRLHWIYSSSIGLCLIDLFMKIIDTIGEDGEGEGIVLQQYPWEGSDRDYEYEEVLETHFEVNHPLCSVLSVFCFCS